MEIIIISAPQNYVKLNESASKVHIDTQPRGRGDDESENFGGGKSCAYCFGAFDVPLINIRTYRCSLRADASQCGQYVSSGMCV